MKLRSTRIALVVFALAILVGTAAALAVTQTTSSSSAHAVRAGQVGEAPRGLERKLDRKFDQEVVNSNFKNESEGPNSAGDQAFDALAYPYGDVTASQFNAARSTFQSIKSKGVGNG